MLKRCIIGLIIFLGFNSFVFSQEKQIADSTVSFKTEYLIDGKIVSKKQYEQFKSKLKEIDKTYQCMMFPDGAANNYDAKDKNGVKYIVGYSLNTETKQEKYIISKK